MAGIIVVDRLESDASYASSINIASPVIISNTATFSSNTVLTSNVLYLANTNNFALQFQPDVAGRLRIASSASTFGDNNPFVIERPSSASAQNDAITIRSGGVVDLGKGQLKFPASQNASADANTLDDYEEGTWTPVLSTTGTNFSSVSYNTTNTRGTYTKIGDTVFFRGVLLTTGVTVGSASGTVQISGLPFTSQSVAERPAVALAEQGQYGAWSTTPISGSISSGAAAFLLNKLASLGGSQSNLAASDVGTGATGNFFMFSGQYKIA